MRHPAADGSHRLTLPRPARSPVPVKDTEMTIRTEPSVHDYLSRAPSPAWWGPDVDRSMRRASLTAGIGTLLMIPLAVFGNFVAVQVLLTHGDAETTARDILASEGPFRRLLDRPRGLSPDPSAIALRYAGHTVSGSK
jgi:hypothetical protein